MNVLLIKYIFVCVQNSKTPQEGRRIKKELAERIPDKVKPSRRRVNSDASGRTDRLEFNRTDTFTRPERSRQTAAERESQRKRIQKLRLRTSMESSTKEVGVTATNFKEVVDRKRRQGSLNNIDAKC